MDDRLLYLINGLPHSFAAFWGVMALRYGAFVVLIVLILGHIGSRRRFFKAAFIILSTWLAADLLKFLFNRPRPAEMLAGLIVQHDYWSPSFPSAETALAFALATLFSFLESRHWRVAIAYVLACLVGLTRLYLGAHYPSDVLAGALIGIGGVAIWRLHRRKIL